MTETTPNPWLVFAMPYFCFIPTMPVSYQNFHDMEKLAENEVPNIKDWRRKVRKPYTRTAPFQVVPEYDAMRKDIENHIKQNRYLKIGVIYDLMDAQGLIPISKTYGEKITKGAFAHHYREAKKNVVMHSKTKIESIKEMYENGESVKDIALKLCTNRDYVTRQIKRIKENAETS
jgi:hypothetical protein